MIAGFVIEGASMQLLLRAIGPALEGFGVAGVLADPEMKLTTADGAFLLGNDDCGAGPDAVAMMSALERTGAFVPAAGSLDAAILALQPVDGYTVVVRRADDSVGVALAEMYEVPAGEP